MEWAVIVEQRVGPTSFRLMAFGPFTRTTANNTVGSVWSLRQTEPSLNIKEVIAVPVRTVFRQQEIINILRDNVS